MQLLEVMIYKHVYIKVTGQREELIGLMDISAYYIPNGDGA